MSSRALYKLAYLYLYLTFPAFRRNPFSIRAKRKNAGVGDGHGDMGHGDNIRAFATHSLAEV